MSANHLPKLNKATLVEALVFLGLGLLVAVNARIILENLLESRQIADEIVSEASPRLNRTIMEEAVSALENDSQENLTSPSPTVTVENETSGSPVRIDIQNASGVDGAASDLREILIQRGYQIGAISTAPSFENQTVIFHGTGRVEEARRVQTILQEEGWAVGKLVESQGSETDLTLVLGKASI